MPINLTDELYAKTAKGKIASARQVYLDGDEVNLQQVADKTSQLEQTVKNITVSGGASNAESVSYDNSSSRLTAVNIQSAVDELVTKDSNQDRTIEELSRKAVSTDDLEFQLDKKVDKQDGKSLIDDDVADSFEIIQSEDFIYAIADADHHILFGIDRDTGKPVYPLNDMYHIDDNEDYLAVWTDANDKIILGIRRDGQIEGRFSNVDALTKMVSTLKADIDELKSMGSFEVSSFFSTVEDTDNRLQMTTDEQGHILSYRDYNGVLHEQKMDVASLSVGDVNFRTSALASLSKALKQQGFSASSPVDWSDSSFIQIQEPRFAMINISGITAMPESKTQNLHAYLEFWDRQGNYFRKRCILNAQGNSSMDFPKKNMNVDFCDDDWVGEDVPRIRVGNWVPQSSFHLKANYTDFFRGISVVSYKLYDEIVRQHDIFNDRPWKKAMIDKTEIGLGASAIDTVFKGDVSLAVESAARCVPDGFPVACYLNGEFYGLFTFQLKKHPDNYRLDPSNVNHIHLDGALNESNFWMGTINWSVISVRNPKYLYAIDGTPYDPDVKKQELAGEEQLNAWKSAGCLPDGTVFSFRIRRMVENTAKVKNAIQRLADVMVTLKQDNEDTLRPNAQFTRIFPKYFDNDNIIDYNLFSDLVQNIDGFGNNWQWITYNGEIWYVVPYDCDSTFGADFTGRSISAPMSSPFSSIGSVTNPSRAGILYDSLSAINAKYKSYETAYNNGVITPGHVFSCVRDWMDRIGPSFYQLEFEKWKDSPCINSSEVNTDYWDLVLDENGTPVITAVETSAPDYTIFDASKQYSVGDVVTYDRGVTYKYNDGLKRYYKFRCIKDITEPKYDGTTVPLNSVGHVDSIYRIYNWIYYNAKSMDIWYKPSTLSSSGS